VGQRKKTIAGDRVSAYWQDKTVLVTGAGGFIGSHLVERLALEEAHVRAFVRYNSRADVGLLKMLPPDVFESLEVIMGDLRDLTAVQQAALGVSHIFHLGALIAIPYSYLHPAEVVETNVIGTLNVLLAARDLKVERVIHTSTSEVYGTAIRVPIDEDHPLQGQSPYSASKIGADKIAESFYRAFDLPVATIRPFNTYGPRQSARAVIPTIITQALTQNVVRLGNLDARRDLTYVADTVEGFLKIGQVPGVEGETFNLGTGEDVRIGDLVDQILRLIGKPVEVQVDSSRLRPEKSEVQRLQSDHQRASQKLGWLPKTQLTAGLEQTIAWISENIHLYQPDRYQV
jgi:NAD dependent epimerase/dehydratase